jgi:hypothetical protein
MIAVSSNSLNSAAAFLSEISTSRWSPGFSRWITTPDRKAVFACKDAPYHQAYHDHQFLAARLVKRG